MPEGTLGGLVGAGRLEPGDLLIGGMRHSDGRRRASQAVSSAGAAICRAVWGGARFNCGMSILPPPPSFQPVQPFQAPPALRLVLPAASLQGLASLPADGAVALLHGPMVLQPVAGALLVLVSRLMPGPPRALPPDAGTWGRPGQAGRLPDPQALAVVVQAPAGQAPPADGPALLAPSTAAGAAAAWDHWLAWHAPEHRLACRARSADLLLLWCSDRTPRLALLRCGDGWARLANHAPWVLPAAATGGGRHPPWVVVPTLDLPGCGLRRQCLTALTFGVAADATPRAPAKTLTATAPTSGSRHSRQALALTSAVLHRLQRQRVGIVGCGQVGTALASSLVRLGVEVCVLDPADMTALHLQADLPPWGEGRPKVQALRRQLQGLPVAGAQVDGRQLPVASPAAGSLLAACDIVVATAPGDAVRAAEAWALALLKPLLVIATDVAQADPEGVPALAAPPASASDLTQAWLALLPPGTGCLHCIGRWPTTWDAAPGSVRPALRSWSVLVANLGLRLLEHLAAGRLHSALVRHLSNGTDGSLQVRDWRPFKARADCPRCMALAGAGLQAAAEDIARCPADAGGRT